MTYIKYDVYSCKQIYGEVVQSCSSGVNLAMCPRSWVQTINLNYFFSRSPPDIRHEPVGVGLKLVSRIASQTSHLESQIITVAHLWAQRPTTAII